MQLLLDTHVFIWVVTDSDKLKEDARGIIRGADQVHVSAASIWEIAIKARLGKIDGNPSELAQAITQSGFAELPVRSAHAAKVTDLPLHHNDPFDRLLIAQAMVEPLMFLTADSLLGRYSDLVRAV
jgi:PIN domain nuclease of toxin-antitoxin system